MNERLYSTERKAGVGRNRLVRLGGKACLVTVMTTGMVSPQNDNSADTKNLSCDTSSQWTIQDARHSDATLLGVLNQCGNSEALNTDFMDAVQRGLKTETLFDADGYYQLADHIKAAATGQEAIDALVQAVNARGVHIEWTAHHDMVLESQQSAVSQDVKLDKVRRNQVLNMLGELDDLPIDLLRLPRRITIIDNSINLKTRYGWNGGFAFVDEIVLPSASSALPHELMHILNYNVEAGIDCIERIQQIHDVNSKRLLDLIGPQLFDHVDQKGVFEQAVNPDAKSIARNLGFVSMYSSKNSAEMFAEAGQEIIRNPIQFDIDRIRGCDDPEATPYDVTAAAINSVLPATDIVDYWLSRKIYPYFGIRNPNDDEKQQAYEQMVLQDNPLSIDLSPELSRRAHESGYTLDPIITLKNKVGEVKTISGMYDNGRPTMAILNLANVDPADQANLRAAVQEVFDGQTQTNEIPNSVIRFDRQKYATPFSTR